MDQFDINLTSLIIQRSQPYTFHSKWIYVEIFQILAHKVPVSYKCKLPFYLVDSTFLLSTPIFILTTTALAGLPNSKFSYFLLK